MRWPWQSDASEILADLLRVQLSDMRARNADLWERLQYEQQRNKDLTDRLYEMQRDGFRTPQGNLVDWDPPAELDEQIEQAIGSRALTADIRRQLEKFAREEIAAGREVEQVVQAILDGEG